MSIDQALLLGLVQGLTEFLPLSSSGHLVIFQQFMGLSEAPLAFDTLIHVATLTAVLLYFRKSIPFFFKQKFLHLVVGTIPAIFFGLFIYRFGQWTFNDLNLLALGFLATSLLLFLAEHITKAGSPLNQLNLKHSLIIGVFQALAILPSISRSGATIAAGRLVGLSKESAFVFSFALSVPAILAAISLTGKDLFSAEYQPTPLLTGFLAAFITGLLSLKLLDILVRRNLLNFFVWYTFILGLFIAGLIS